MNVLDVQGLACGYGGRAVLSDVTFRVAEGRALVLLGPNGAGKTTLFKTVLGFIPRLAGEVRIDGEDVRAWTRKRFAQTVAYVPQAHDTAFGFTVREMVLMGRTPAIAGLASPGREDERIADACIERLGLGALAERDFTTLSGGEQQMVLVARALAQRPRLLVMDEPCANLDVGNQVRVLGRVRALVKRGLAVVITSHDPNHALLLDGDVACVGAPRTSVHAGDAAGADGVQAGASERAGAMPTCAAVGRASQVLTPEALSALYGAEVGVGEVMSARGRVGRACAAFLDEERV